VANSAWFEYRDLPTGFVRVVIPHRALFRRYSLGCAAACLNGVMRISVVLLTCAATLFAASAFAETKTMSLREALDLALAQNPDLMLARLDQQKSRDQVTIARDPFHPKVFVGTGGAWTSGFPASIDGSAPSIFQAKTQMALFDQPQRYQIAVANENMRGVGIDVAKQQEDIAYRVTVLYLDAERAGQALQTANREIENLARVVELTQTRVEEGRNLPIDSTRARHALTGAHRVADGFALDLVQAETALAMALGMKPDDRVHAKEREGTALTIPLSEQESIDQALESSHDLKRLESAMQAKELEIKSYKAQKLPKINLVAQYEFLAKYSYQDFFSKFQRNAAQLGASIEVPVLMGHSSRAYVSLAEADIAKLRIQTDQTRARIAADLRRAFQEIKRAESSRDYAREDLDLAREQVRVNLVQNDEGKLPMSDVEKARAEEQQKWLAYYEAQHVVELARLNVLKNSGTLLAAIK
jgi:outer membrane protein